MTRRGLFVVTWRQRLSFDMANDPTIRSVEPFGLYTRIEFSCGHVVNFYGDDATAETCLVCEGLPMAEKTAGDVVTLRSSDHPEARGRFFEAEDRRCYFVKIPLDDGRTLRLEFGPKGRLQFERLILDVMLNQDKGSDDPAQDRSWTQTVRTLAALGGWFYGSGGPGQIDPRTERPIPERHGLGVRFACPCGCPIPVYLPFQNPIDGLDTIEAGWTRQGTTIETLSLDPVIQRVGGCGWRGTVTNGTVYTL